jgi:hypothetical protein
VGDFSGAECDVHSSECNIWSSEGYMSVDTRTKL